jgi:AraC-like DNA-binding protein
VYRELPPRPDGAVGWTRTVRRPGGSTRVLPDGCIDVLWSNGELFIAGPDSAGRLVADTAGAEWAGLRFAPGTAPAVLGIPANELLDQTVPLDAVWRGAEVRRLAERIDGAPDRLRALSAAIAPAVAEPWVKRLVTGLRRGTDVATLAGEVAFSPRQLHRRCVGLFGYGPKTLSRILRLGRALDLARSGVTFGTVAADAGYADQAHLARDVRALTGITLRELLG